MTCASVTIRLRGLMYVNLANQSVTYVSGTFVTLDSGLNTPLRKGKGTMGRPPLPPAKSGRRIAGMNRPIAQGPPGVTGAFPTDAVLVGRIDNNREWTFLGAHDVPCT